LEMAQFLSLEWFEEVEHALANSERAGGVLGADPALVVEISVTGAPQGDVRYQVVVEGERARVVPPGAEFKPAQVELRSDYASMAGIASGRLSAIEALSLGRARVAGDTAALASDGWRLTGLDLLPAAVREQTTF